MPINIGQMDVSNRHMTNRLDWLPLKIANKLPTRWLSIGARTLSLFTHYCVFKQPAPATICSGRISSQVSDQRKGWDKKPDAPPVKILPLKSTLNLLAFLFMFTGKLLQFGSRLLLTSIKISANP